MAGITLIFSVVVLLFVSLCKVLHGSVSTMKASFSFVAWEFSEEKCDAGYCASRR
ncbi:hypothetical protein OROMI_009410 [Orobanche minor]